MPKSSTAVDYVESGGIYARGVVVGRSKTQVGDPPVQKVTYRILSKDGVIRVDRFGEHEYLSVGEKMEWPIQFRPFVRKSGQIGYNIAFNDGTNPFEEEF